MYASVYVYLYKGVYPLYISKYTYVHVSMHENTCIYICVCTYIHVCTYIYINIYIYTYICMYMHMYIYTCMYIMYIVIRNLFQIRGYLSRSKVVSGGQGAGLADRGALQSAPAACVRCFSYGSALIYYGNPALKLSPSVASAAPIACLSLQNRRY